MDLYMCITASETGMLTVCQLEMLPAELRDRKVWGFKTERRMGEEKAEEKAAGEISKRESKKRPKGRTTSTTRGSQRQVQKDIIQVRHRQEGVKVAEGYHNWKLRASIERVSERKRGHQKAQRLQGKPYVRWKKDNHVHHPELLGGRMW